MAASNFGGFSWTEEKSSIILEIMTHLVISKKLDVLADGTIEMVLSKLVEFKDFTLFRGITTQDVKEHLLERRKIYMRVCELANHPNVIGFLQNTCKIWMRSEVYEIHIKGNSYSVLNPSVICNPYLRNSKIIV